jgi:hypothetical protein
MSLWSGDLTASGGTTDESIKPKTVPELRINSKVRIYFSDGTSQEGIYHGIFNYAWYEAHHTLMVKIEDTKKYPHASNLYIPLSQVKWIRVLETEK